MNGPAPGGNVDVLSTTIGDRQEQIPPFHIDNAAFGHLRVYHGQICFVGNLPAATGPRIALMVGIEGCDCGCGMAGRAMLYTPAPEHARIIAAQLIEQADQIEAAAVKQAADLLGKVTGK